MTDQYPEPGAPSEPSAPSDRPAEGEPSLAGLLDDRLTASSLAEGTKALLAQALGDAHTVATSAASRIYLDSVAVTGFRGIGPRVKLDLAPRPSVTLVVGRNGSGKSSLAEGIETAFTGTSARWDGRNTVWRSNWRNLHTSDGPKVEIKLGIGDDSGPSTLTRTWVADDVSVSEAEFRRPGHGRRPFAESGLGQALKDYRPFLSYTDLDRMISGKPAEMYDAIATILGLGHLTAADDRLQAMEKTLNAALKGAEEERPDVVEMLSALEDPRARAALAALNPAAGSPDFDALAALMDGLPEVEDGFLNRLRATAAIKGPDLGAVGSAVDRLREAVAVLEDVRASGAEDAHQRAELLDRALEHSRRHPDEEACPVCGADRPLDECWAERAADQIAGLRREAETAEAARSGLRTAVDEVRYLVAQAPAWLPDALVDPWEEWSACRKVADPEKLASRAEGAAVVLADACAVLRDEAVLELEKLDEGWRRAVARLAGWAGRARTAEAGKPRLREVRAARRWLKTAVAELREERLAPIASRSQEIWEDLRQQSNVDLRSVRLTGMDKSAVRKLVTDVTIEGEAASALSVMSQGELHSLALSLFLPRAVAADSPFGFVVIDDPVQSMDPAKVNGLAKVLHGLGESRQVVVFTHDTRLQRAFTNQELPVTVLEVERGEKSLVKVVPVTDPVKQALDDARALARTEGMPPQVMTHVLPGICRTVLERAFTEAAWRWLREKPEDDAEKVIAGALTLRGIAALGLFGDASKGDRVYPALRTRYGPWAVELVKQCQEGAHPAGASIPDPLRFVDTIGTLAQKVRKPEVSQP
ncbi:AAA family ATPase [Streptomyces sp. NPDC058409]|uniref:AAA family ATPase n=1 Tax=Streptomyces sp. NPDC058409 TaxID=3346484 RepID=UPI00365CEF16